MNVVSVNCVCVFCFVTVGVVSWFSYIICRELLGVDGIKLGACCVVFVGRSVESCALHSMLSVACCTLHIASAATNLNDHLRSACSACVTHVAAVHLRSVEESTGHPFATWTLTRDLL